MILRSLYRDYLLLPMKGFPASILLLFVVVLGNLSWVLALPQDVVPKDSGKFILGLDILLYVCKFSRDWIVCSHLMVVLL